MVKVYYKTGRIEQDVVAQHLTNLNLSDVVWIDLTAPTQVEQTAAENETTSKYSDTWCRQDIFSPLS